jgi:isoleucyl-tRNA synthetase
MAEDAWLSLPWTGPTDSIFQSGWAGASSGAARAPDARQQQYWRRPSDADRRAWEGVLAVREAANAVLEKARTAKLIGPALEAALTLHVADESVAAALRALGASGNGADEPRYLFIASEVAVAGSPEEVKSAVGSGEAGGFCETVETEAAGAVTVGVARAAGSKCARCWNFSAEVGRADAAHPELCERCVPVIRAQGFELPGVAAAGKTPVAAA